MIYGWKHISELEKGDYCYAPDFIKHGLPSTAVCVVNHVGRTRVNLRVVGSAASPKADRHGIQMDVILKDKEAYVRNIGKKPPWEL